MVGYGESLAKARRPGWESAYIEYGNLKSLVEEVERLYQTLEDPPINTPTASYEGEQEALLEDGLTFVDEADTLEKAAGHSELFLRALRKQVEKVSLFALSRQGQLADAVGSLRFNPYLTVDGEEGAMTKNSSFIGKPQNLTIRYDSKGNLNPGKYTYGSLSSGSTLDSSSRTEGGAPSPYVDELSFLLPQMSRQMSEKDENSSLRLRESLDTSPRPLFTGKAVFELKNADSNAPLNMNGHGSYAKNDGDENNEWALEEDKDTEESSVLDPYTLVGVELLHLLRFICINAMGVRKILKKYDKIIEKYAVDSDFNDEKLREDLNNISPFVSSFSFNTDQGPDVHLQQLTNSESIAAITLSLLKASIKAGSMNILTMEQYLVHDETLLRFKCAIDCIDILREYANVVNQPFPAFLSRQAMIVTGYDLGGIEGMKQNALEVLLAFDPDTILHMDKLDLSEWQQRCWEYTFTSAGNKMRKTSFDLIEDANQAVRDRTLSWGGVDAPSMFINLMSILLYTVNYYIVAPTANRYASHLGAKGAFGSTIIGASSVAAIFSALVYSLWYSKLSMKSALIFSSLCPIVGNLMYIVALSQKSFKMALIGRVLVGFGSAEVVNRQLISSCVHLNYMTKASVGFVVAGALGMSIGPLLAAILDKYAGRDFEIDFSLPYVGGIIVDHVSSPGFLMAFLWFIQLLAVIFRFSEPFRINGRSDSKKKKKATSFVSRLKGTFGLVFSNPGLPLTLFVFAYVEMICEVLISSCAMVSKEYFGWKGSMAGFLIACLGALVLPAHFVVERTSRTFDERAIMKYSLIFITVALFGVVNYEQVYHGIRVSSNYVENKSVETWHTVKDTSTRDWQILEDPKTWQHLRNETQKDWEDFENMTAEEWIIFKTATIHEWQKLEEEGAEEWQKLGYEAKAKYAQLANATREEWVELNKDVKDEWNKVVNETEDEWEKLAGATKKEWKLLPNQTEEEWRKINHGAHDEWKKLGNQSANEWEKLRDGTEAMWNNIEHTTDHKFHQAQDAASKATDALAHEAGDIRDATSSKWSKLSNKDSEGRQLLHKKHQLQTYDFGWGYYAYLIGISSIFMGVIILEGVDTSIMCKTAPSQLNATFINVGLLATMLGAVGRVLGNSMITLSAFIPVEYADFVNCVFIPLIPITLCCLHYVRRYYDSLD